MAFTLQTARDDDGNSVLIVDGEIDLSNIDEFDQALVAAATDATTRGVTLTVDISAVKYLDSAAINALSAQSEFIKKLVAPSILMSTVAISGLNELVTIEPAPSTPEH
jgi:anti-anti-sigma factor